MVIRLGPTRLLYVVAMIFVGVLAAMNNNWIAVFAVLSAMYWAFKFWVLLDMMVLAKRAAQVFMEKINESELDKSPDSVV